MHVLHVVDARPNLMKAAPVHRALADRGVVQTIVHTGQHYAAMSDGILKEVGLPEPAPTSKSALKFIRVDDVVASDVEGSHTPVPTPREPATRLCRSGSWRERQVSARTISFVRSNVWPASRRISTYSAPACAKQPRGWQRRPTRCSMSRTTAASGTSRTSIERFVLNSA